MSTHVDALGYLLAAVVFSVGFLSARIHSNLDSTVGAISERSWRVRQAISDGGRLGPADLADLLGVVRSSRDYVALGSRILNWTIFATTCAVLGDAVALREDGAQAPDHEMLVLVLLFAASLAVVMFAEFDVRRVSIDQRREVAVSTLGRLQRLAQLMERADIPRASRELTRLRETFPTWGLLVEFEAYVDLLRSRPREGLERIESLLTMGGDLYVSPVVGAACCLEADGLDDALELIVRIERRGESIRHLDRLHRAMAVTAGHLPALLAGLDILAPTDPARDHTTPHGVAQSLIGEEIERRREPVHQLALDLDPAKVRQTVPLMATLDLWEHGDQLSDLTSDGPLPMLLHLVLEPKEQMSVGAALESYATRCHDPVTLESFGLVALACGEPRVALGYFESAIRLAPAAARSHWGRAIACHQVGWSDAASASLRRVATLSDDAPLLSLTRRLLQGHTTRIGSVEAARSYPQGLSDMDRFELALVGIDVGGQEGEGIRDRFVSGLIGLALEHRASEAPV